MSQPAPRALVVDDDPTWRQLLTELLEDCGLQVDAADSLEAAGLALKAQPHRVAVVDLSLSPSVHSNQDGLRALEAVQRLDPGCRAVLLTGFATVEVAVAALSAHGAFAFLRKENFQRAEFRQIVQRALASAPPPAGGEADGPPTPAAPAEPAAPTALVVEDDAGWRSLLEEMLVDAGYQVRACASFGEALGCLRREKFSLAVVDLSLAGEAGWREPAGRQGYPLLVSARAAGVPAIVVSGVAAPAEIERAYAEQAIFAYLEKQTFERAAFLRAAAEARARGLAADPLRELTAREREVLACLARGLTNKQIAAELVIVPDTVKRHLKAIFQKLGVHTRAAAAAKALEEKK